MMQADVLGAGRGTLLGKMEISNAILDGNDVILCTRRSDTPSRVEIRGESPLVKVLLAHSPSGRRAHPIWGTKVTIPPLSTLGAKRGVGRVA